jgi:hypothetical protein
MGEPAGRCVYDKCQAGFFKFPSFFLVLISPALLSADNRSYQKSVHLNTIRDDGRGNKNADTTGICSSEYLYHPR